LAAALNVSVTPVREALRELSTQGLVEIDAFRGAVVHTPTLAELEEIYEMRAVLIPLSVSRGIANITLQEMDRAEALLSCMEATTDQTAWVEINRDFHNLLDEVTKTRQLREMLSRLSDLSAIYVNLSFADKPLQKVESEQEHREILAAYRLKDQKLATDLTLSHINATLEAARQSLLQKISLS
jgi:DNA-binding GntR family transcriptional regulator